MTLLKKIKKKLGLINFIQIVLGLYWSVLGFYWNVFRLYWSVLGLYSDCIGIYRKIIRIVFEMYFGGIIYESYYIVFWDLFYLNYKFYV